MADLRDRVPFVYLVLFTCQLATWNLLEPPGLRSAGAGGEKSFFISVIRWKQAAICWRWRTSFCRCFHLPILRLFCFCHAVVLEIVSKCDDRPRFFFVFCICRYCFPFGRPDGALKATLSLQERVREHVSSLLHVEHRYVCANFDRVSVSRRLNVTSSFPVRLWGSRRDQLLQLLTGSDPPGTFLNISWFCTRTVDEVF